MNMKLPALYELSHQYREALEVLADADLPPEVVSDTLEGLQGDLQEKATNVARFFRSLEATADAMKEAEERMAKRRKAVLNRVEQMKAYLLHNMQACQIKKIDGPEFSLSVRDNPASVVILDPAELPPELMVEKVSHSPDKRAIKERIEAGEVVPGARLERGQSLRIS